MDYFKQLELRNDPIKLAMEELINPKIDQLNFDDWIAEKREIGKRKFNRPINRKARREAIRKKQLGLR